VSVRGGGNTGESGNEGMGRRGDDVRLRRKRGRGGLALCVERGPSV
jgi:hypothetical protein